MKRHPKRFYLAICTHCGRAWYGTRMNATHEEATSWHTKPGTDRVCREPVNVRTRSYYVTTRPR